jgi:uncharacterized caspase-like protein
MSPLDSTNFLNLSKDGTFRASGQLKSEPAHIDQLFKELKVQKSPHLVLYFHGGLVSEERGHAGAKNLYPLFADKIGAHPLFFIWESGGLEIIRSNLHKLRDTELFKELLNLVLKYTVSKLEAVTDPGRSVGERVEIVADPEVEKVIAEEETGQEASPLAGRDGLEPLSSDQEKQFADMLKNRISFQKAAAQVAVAVEETAEGRGLGAGPVEGEADLEFLDDEVLEELEAEVTGEDEAGRGLITQAFLIKSAVGILTRVVGRVINKTDHGLVCTVTEEILRQFYLNKVGGWLWGQMKETIEGAFKPNDGLSGDLLHGGSYLLDRLNAYLSDGENPPIKVSMIGHSAGSIYICRLFEAALQKLPANFKFNQIVFLAPGVDFELFKSTLVDHPDRFEGFMLYTMNDELESKDAIAGPAYPRSLLYFVSGALEDQANKPIVGLERFYSGQKPYDTPVLTAATKFIKSAEPRRVVWSSTTGAEPGFNVVANTHGGFAEEPVTQESLLAILKPKKVAESGRGLNGDGPEGEVEGGSEDEAASDPDPEGGDSEQEAAPPNPEDYAIVVGINNYPGIRSLFGAEKDAAEFANWLLKPDGGGLDRNNLRLILSSAYPQPQKERFFDAKPIKDDIDRAFIDFGVLDKDRVGRRLYFFFAGHGLAPSFDDVALLMANASRGLLNSNLGIRPYRTYLVDAAPFDQLVIALDCCREFSEGATPVGPIFTWRRADDRAPHVQEYFMMSAEYGRKAYEPEEGESGDRRGLLTRAMLEGLDQRLAADAQGSITAASLTEYINRRLPELAKEANLKQKPDIRGIPDNMVFGAPLAQPPAAETAKTTIQIAAGLGGEVILSTSTLDEIERCAADQLPWQVELSPGVYILTHDPSRKQIVIDARRLQDVEHEYTIA